MLDINGLCGPRLSHDEGGNITTAELLASQQRQERDGELLENGGAAGGGEGDPLTGAAAAAAATAHLFARYGTGVGSGAAGPQQYQHQE